MIVVNETEAKPVASTGTAVSLPKSSPSQVNTTPIGINKAPTHGIGPIHDPLQPTPTKNPVHGTGSSHDPRSPSQTHDRNFGNWGHRHWNSRYGCEYCWSEVFGCEFYFYAPADCYYPVSCIEQFPPARTPVAPVTVVPTRGFVPAIHITNTYRHNGR